MPELPDSVVETARAITRAIRRGTHQDPEALRERRDTLLARFEYTARVREDDSGPVLVCHPAAWLDDDGVFQPEAMESTAAAVERDLFEPAVEGGWAAIEAHNRELAGEVQDRYGDPHGATATAFAEYMANHHEATIEAASESAVETFLTEYLPRNAWPTQAQKANAETSIRRLFDVAGEPVPLDRDRKR
ncbi:rnhA operon protein [Halodesulfurarchaeum sp. HSR-GB]|uniref:DUF7108 family protein n=1 Tax=Halodesulfurarchaeum sp. HSR-GB TaxID=3074077 RepID=UPI002859258A|nr:rnhA operon protein [Halodesulfurarchaeum sp. HSR-GB]MDR5656752.1 rnhA operon protein [Halodesulfurarchaeum sp. HSR-GB]